MSSLSQRVRIAAKAAIGIFSENSMRVAYGMLGGVLPGGMGTPPTRGTTEYLRAYSEMPWLRAVSSRIASAVAKTDWQLFVLRKASKNNGRARWDATVRRIQKSGRPERVRLLKQAAAEQDLDQIIDHPLLDVLSNANEFQTGMAMRKVTQLHLDLTGDAFWLKERDAQGTVVGVWPIPPNWIVATPTPSFRFFRISFRAWRGNIPDTEFVWFSDDDPFNPYARGVGTAKSLSDELETDEYAAKHTRSYFYNQARPDMLVWPKGGNLTPGNVAKLEEDWLSHNQGFWRAFKPYFLSREVEVKEIDSMGNFRAQQLVQLRQFERDTILQVYGLPPEILGVLENSNRSTIDAADYLMSKYVVEPRLEFQRSVLQERLIPEYDERLIIDFVSPVQEDQAARMEAAKAAPWSLDMDEWRSLSGHAPMEDEDAGKLRMVPTLVKPMSVEQLLEPPPPPPTFVPGLPPGTPAGALPPGDEKPPKPPVPPAADEKPPKMRRAISLSGDLDAELDDVTVALRAGDVVLAETLQKATTLDIDKLPAPAATAARLEPALARALTAAWKDHAAGLKVSAIAAALPNVDHVVQQLDLAGLNDAQTAALQARVEQAFVRGAELGASALRGHGVAIRRAWQPQHKQGPAVAVNFSQVNPLAVQHAQQHAGELVLAPPKARDSIRALVTESIEDGIPPEDLAVLIRGTVGLTPKQVQAVSAFRRRLVDSAEDYAEGVIERRVLRYAGAQLAERALTIARTELMSALNAGQQALWGEAVKQGAIKENEFEQIWLVTEDDLLDEEICEPLADARAPIGEPFEGGYSGPPAHPRCRCAIGLVPVEAP